jgi:hypothetical protein
MSLNKIYQIVPQMKAYHSLGVEWLPYIMFSQTPNFRSNFVNTDSEGFRFNGLSEIKFETIFNLSNLENVTQIVCGGSFGFGTGATDDTKTISSILSSSGNKTLNFSGSAFVGFQDIISFLANLHNLKEKKIKKIFIFTGINDFFLTEVFGNSYPDIMYFYANFIKAMSTQILSTKKKLFYDIVNFIKPGCIDINLIKNLNKENIIKFIFFSKFRSEFLKKNKTKPLSFEEKLNRNFMIYKMIEKHFDAEINIFLSPYIFWSKDLSKEEIDLVRLSKQIPSKVNNKFHSILTKENYNYLLKKMKYFSESNNFNFFDLNDIIKSNCYSSDWLFVDSVHCTDLGYKLVSEVILKK